MWHSWPPVWLRHRTDKFHRSAATTCQALCSVILKTWPCQLSTVTQLLFHTSIYVDAFMKWDKNEPREHIQETDRASPLCSCLALILSRGDRCNCFFHPFLCLRWLKPISAGWAFQFISQRWHSLTQTYNEPAPGSLSKHIEGAASQFG